MAFCGQCGFLLPPKATTCSRCGSAVMSSWESADQNPNAPTIISPLDKAPQTENPYQTKPELVQELNQFAGSNSETQRVEQGNNTPIPPTIQNTAFSEYHAQTPLAPPDYPSQTGSYFPNTQGVSSPGYTTTQGVPYPSYVSPPGLGYPPPPVPPHRTRNSAIPLVILLILFSVGATGAVFLIGPNQILQMLKGGTVASQTTPVPPTSQVSTPVPLTPTTQPSSTPEQQAQSVIDRYYTAINSKDYQTAYNLWLNYPDSYQNFANGFANTSHDGYTFGNVVQQSDGKVQVDITIIATSTSYQQTTYQGYYIVGQQPDGSWKITSAKIHKI